MLLAWYPFWNIEDITMKGRLPRCRGKNVEVAFLPKLNYKSSRQTYV